MATLDSIFCPFVDPESWENFLKKHQQSNFAVNLLQKNNLTWLGLLVDSIRSRMGVGERHPTEKFAVQATITKQRDHASLCYCAPPPSLGPLSEHIHVCYYTDNIPVSLLAVACWLSYCQSSVVLWMSWRRRIQSWTLPTGCNSV
jgi:hypothetical protein